PAFARRQYTTGGPPGRDRRLRNLMERSPISQGDTMNKLLITLACFACVAVAAGTAGDGKGAIEGSWTATAAFAEGKKLPEDVVAKLTLVATFKDGKYRVTIMG